MRVGIGYDAHRFGGDGPIVLGGVSIPFDRGLVGHSDADVLAHAVGDALLGAACLGDLGAVFPSSDERLRGASSLGLLRIVAGMLAGELRGIVNVDAVVIAERPALAPYRGAMRDAIASALGIEPETISVKATTTDGLGFTGRGEGIAATAVALIEP